jgi:hypothetical protein
MGQTGWICPRCDLILAPHVAQHRCDPPSAGVTASPVVAPYQPVTGATATVTYPQTCTVTTGTAYHMREGRE